MFVPVDDGFSHGPPVPVCFILPFRDAHLQELLHVLYSREADEGHVSGSQLIAEASVSPEQERAASLGPDSLPARAVITRPFNVEQPPHIAVNVGLRCIGVRPDSDDIALGDRRGTLRCVLCGPVAGVVFCALPCVLGLIPERLITWSVAW